VPPVLLAALLVHDALLPRPTGAARSAACMMATAPPLLKPVAAAPAPADAPLLLPRLPWLPLLRWLYTAGGAAAAAAAVGDRAGLPDKLLLPSAVAPEERLRQPSRRCRRKPPCCCCCC
jgi:hypothetical protein